jgi:tRNA pseudouridine55 synthase
MIELTRRQPFGFINLCKSAGRSSSQVGYRVRASLHAAGGGVGKVRDLALGHFGTLDPPASGVLPLAVGKATRLLPLIADRRKVYQFTLVLGRSTATGDATGSTVQELPVPDSLRIRIPAVLAEFRGIQQQLPPMVSAVHHEGRRLYELAREGKTVPRTPRAIEIFELSWLGGGDHRFQFRVRCSEGTYVRSLCEDMALALGTVGHMDELVREAAGPFSLANAHSLEDVDRQPLAYLLDPRTILPLPQVPLDVAAQRLWQHGMRVTVATAVAPAPTVFVVDGTLEHAPILGFAEWTGEFLIPQRVF